MAPRANVARPSAAGSDAPCTCTAPLYAGYTGTPSSNAPLHSSRKSPATPRLSLLDLRRPRDRDRRLHALVRRAACRVHRHRPLRDFPLLFRDGKMVGHVDLRDPDRLARSVFPLNRPLDVRGICAAVEVDLAGSQGPCERAVESASHRRDNMVQGGRDRWRAFFGAVVLP